MGSGIVQMLTPAYWPRYIGDGFLCGVSVCPLLAIWVACLCVSRGVWGVGKCPVSIHVRYGTVVVRRSGTGGTLWYCIGVAGGAVPVPYRYGTVRYMFGMDGDERYNTVPVDHGIIVRG